MFNQENSGDQYLKACSYSFDSYRTATDVARELASLGAIDVEILRKGDKTCVKCKAKWAVEQQIISIVSKDAGLFRTNNSTSKEERELIKEMYLCWHDPVEMEDVFRRNKASLVKMLEYDGLLISYPNKNFVYDWDEMFGSWETKFSPSNGFSEILVEMLQKAGVLDGSEKQFLVGEDGDHQSINYLPVNNLSQTEVLNLYSLFYNAGAWEHGKELAILQGDRINAVRWLRREFKDQNPVEFFFVLGDEKGLPMEMLYQKELAKAYWEMSLIKGYSRAVGQWAVAAQARVNDYFMMTSIAIPHALKHPELSFDNPIICALAAISDEKLLESLAKKNNRLAAAILADMHRLRMRQSEYPLNAADRWATIQDSYWPTEQEVSNAIASCISCDYQYAKKMEHVAFKYSGCWHKNYTVGW